MGRLFFIIFLLVPFLVGAQPYELKENTLSGVLKTKWLYTTDDHPDIAQPQYNDSGWKAVDPSLDIERTTKDFKGIAWFRLHVMVDSTLTDKPIAIQIQQSGASEIYVDGDLIHRFGYINGPDSSQYFDPHNEPLAIVFDTAGLHTLAIRYANYNVLDTRYATQHQNPGLSIDMELSYLANTAYHDRFFAISIIVLVVAGLCFALCLLHIFLFLFHREERTNIYFSFFCLALGSSFLLPYLAYYNHTPHVSEVLYQWALVAACSVTFALSGMSNELFSKHRWRFYFITLLCIIPVAVSFYHIAAGFILYFLVLIITTMEALVLTIIAMVHRVKGAKIIGTGILLFTLFFLSITVYTLVNRGLYFGEGSDGGQFLMISGLLSVLGIPIFMSVYLGWKFAHINKDLSVQLAQVKELSEKTIAQEQEKKKILENQKEQLEHEVTERTKEIVAEKQKSDDLLLNILPEEVAHELKERGHTDAQYYDHVSVLFTDFVDFTKAGERFTPQQLVDELHTCFKAFDHIISKHGIEKIKTIGDAYLAVCGLPKADEQHAIKTIKAAQEIKTFMQERQQQYPDKTFHIRIGIHSGPVVAGIVGVKKFAYDIWGDTVNTAARMESNSEAGKINISHATYELVKEQFSCTYRGEIDAKGKGSLRMYFVEG